MVGMSELPPAQRGCKARLMTGYSPEAWDSFFVAQAGAAAALSGLLFVGVSINVRTIVASPRLVRRALEAFVVLVEVLILSAVTLVPDASNTALGWALLLISGLAWAVISRTHVRLMATGTGPDEGVAPRWSVPVQIFLGQAATVPFVVGAVTLLLEYGGGLYWFAPGVVFAFVAALANAWVLLIEIERWGNAAGSGGGWLVGEGGLEPPRPCGHRHLKPARLPIPPLARSGLRSVPMAPRLFREAAL